MAAVTVSTSTPTRRAYSESHPRHPFRSPLSSRSRHVMCHMTNHVTSSAAVDQSDSTKHPTVKFSSVGRRREREGGSGERRGEGGGGEGSGESTAEEVDIESHTTTDTLPEEPVDFIECGHSIPRAYSTSALPRSNGHCGPAPLPRVMETSSSLQVHIMYTYYANSLRVFRGVCRPPPENSFTSPPEF